jgi:hypothetical protein
MMDKLPCLLGLVNLSLERRAEGGEWGEVERWRGSYSEGYLPWDLKIENCKFFSRGCLPWTRESP